jgi:hypothetical protein
MVIISPPRLHAIRNNNGKQDYLAGMTGEILDMAHDPVELHAYEMRSNKVFGPSNNIFGVSRT